MILKNKKILITGGAGFIGSHLVDALLRYGATITVVDNLSTGILTNLYKSLPHIHFHQIDMRDKTKLLPIIKKQDIVFHLAANADVPRSIKDPDYDYSENVLGSYNVFTSCLKTNVQKVIFASSAAVYGEPIHTPIKETHPTNPLSPYGVDKLYGEKLGLSFYKTFGLPFTAIRIFNNFGERQQKFVMVDLFRKLRSNPYSLEVMGTGEQIRDYCYVKDGVKCFIKAAMCDTSSGEVFNLASGHPIKIKDLVTLLIQAGKFNNVNIHYTNQSWPGDIMNLSGDCTKTINTLHFTATTTLSEGIQKLYSWINKSSLFDKSSQ